MKNTIKLFVAMRSIAIIALVAVIGFSMIACDDSDGDDDNGNDNGSGGTFTLTNIPQEYNGKYAYLEGWGINQEDVLGCQNANMSTETITLCRISNGSVSLPMWVITYEVKTATLKRYSGNNTFDEVAVLILSQQVLHEDFDALIGVVFKNVTFSNGSAAKSWNDGEVGGWEFEEGN